MHEYYQWCYQMGCVCGDESCVYWIHQTNLFSDSLICKKLKKNKIKLNINLHELEYLEIAYLMCALMKLYLKRKGTMKNKIGVFEHRQGSILPFRPYGGKQLDCALFELI
jgi:hypothetical protein